MSFTLRSPAFREGEAIPTRFAYRGEGQNLSPALAWSEVPSGTRALALVCDDPDAPSPQKPRPKPWVHWVLYDLPPELDGLGEGKSAGGVGKNDFGELAWGGPMPPPGSGRHRYVFTLYALDARCGLATGASKDSLLRAIAGHVLGEARLIGTYERR